MRANALVIETETTWLLIEDVPSGEEGIEAFLSLSTESVDEAERQGDAELARLRDGQTEITVGIDPLDAGDMPFEDWGIGDLADVDGAERRAIALTFSRDPSREGRLVFVPQFGDIIESPVIRGQRIARQMSPGTIGGVARTAARPVTRQPLPVDATVRIPTQRVTQAEYDALDPVLDGVLYVIVA